MGNKPVFPWMTVYISIACTAMLAVQSVLPQPAESRHLPTLLPLLPDYVSKAFSADYSQIPLAAVSFLSYAFQHSGYAHFGVNIFLSSYSHHCWNCRSDTGACLCFSWLAAPGRDCCTISSRLFREYQSLVFQESWSGCWQF